MSGVNRPLEVMPQHLNGVGVQDSDWATPASVEAILLLIYFYALGRCPVAITHPLLSFSWPTDGLKFSCKMS